jgi:hypothetical protein
MNLNSSNFTLRRPGGWTVIRSLVLHGPEAREPNDSFSSCRMLNLLKTGRQQIAELTDFSGNYRRADQIVWAAERWGCEELRHPGCAAIPVHQSYFFFENRHPLS